MLLLPLALTLSGAAPTPSAGDGGAEEEVHGYDSELEYLDDQFATLVQRIQV